MLYCHTLVNHSYCKSRYIWQSGWVFMCCINLHVIFFSCSPHRCSYLCSQSYLFPSILSTFSHLLTSSPFITCLLFCLPLGHLSGNSKLSFILIPIYIHYLSSTHVQTDIIITTILSFVCSSTCISSLIAVFYTFSFILARTPTIRSKILLIY